jgi:hypothetical protein
MREGKKLMRRHFLALLGLLLVVAVAIPAYGIPGPDPADDHDYFEISMGDDFNHGTPPPPPEDTYSVTRFNEAEGWDFGDRYGYQCAWVEYFRGDNQLFEVHYELVMDYPFGVKVSDRFGVEGGDQNASGDCGTGNGFGGVPTHDGTDHFPHATSLTFYQNGGPLLDPQGNPVAIDYQGECTHGYWTAGDQPGEAWLWWDEDGPADKLMHGDGLCSGGPDEPVAVVRAIVQNAAPGIGYCTSDVLEGSFCSGSTTQHSSNVTLKLRHIRASGDVRIPDGTDECSHGRRVRIQRRSSGMMWNNVGSDRTDGTGHYALHVRARKGRYRAWVMEKELASGVLCSAAISRKVLF